MGNAVPVSAATDCADHVDAVVVGGGFAGLYMIYKLRELGLRVRAFEAGEDVGGTWYWNRYPGARCDVESLWYSYSFSPELEQEWEWTEKYPPQREIYAYLRHVADRFGLRSSIAFGTRVRSATYGDGSHRWTVETDRGYTVSAQFLIMATGCLSKPKSPEYRGLDRFSGEWYLTSRWPDVDPDFTGKRVAVIGTGSSGVQCIPVLAERAAHLTVFQRTPNFSVPARNRPIESTLVGEVKSRYREYRREARSNGVGIPMDVPYQSALEVSDVEREAQYASCWERGHLVALLNSYTDLLKDEAANKTVADFVRAKILSTVRDPATAALLSPTDHPFGAKRPCMDTSYYETYNRPDVALVDVRSTPIVEITPTGLRTTGADYPADVIVFATGFDAMTGALLAIDIKGRDGLRLADKWSGGPRSYLGLAMAGFPNLFTITGPGSPSVLANVVVAIENHVEWIGDCVSYLRREGIRALEAEDAAEDAWFAHVHEAAEETLFPRARSWYMGDNIEGKPRVMTAYTGGLDVYGRRCDAIAAAGYAGFTKVR